MPAITTSQLREGMQVYSGEGQPLGAIERVDRDFITVRGQQYQLSSIERAEGDRVHLTRQVAGTAGSGRGERVGVAQDIQEAQGEVRVPEMEERLHVEKRQADMGEVRVQRHVTEERQTVPVELMREQVHVEERDTKDRPATEADLRGAFQEGTIRVPVRGEEAVVTKEAVVTGEVVLNKERTTERQNVTDTIRRTHVDVDENYQKARSGFQQHFQKGRGANGAARFEDAEPNYRRGFEAAHDERNAGKRFEDVEPELQRTHQGSGDDHWERLREEVREGFQRARQ